MKLFDLVAKLTLDSSEYDKELGDAKNKASGFADKLKTGLGTVAKVGAAAVGTAATAIGAIVKQSVDAYGNYEQFVGGIETLFGDSAQTVIKNAASAYQTAGLSANDYMETAIGFSGALLKSLSGDTAAASELTLIRKSAASENARSVPSTNWSVLISPRSSFLVSSKMSAD